LRYTFKFTFMRISAFFLSAFIFVFTISKADTPKNIPLTEVQLYVQSAKLTHKGTVSLVLGKQTVLLKGLASELDESSLQLLGNPQTEILSFQLIREPLRSSPRPPSLAAMIDSSEQLQFEIDLLRANREVLIQEQQLILANKVIGGQQGVSVDQLQKMADFYRIRLQDLNLKLAKSQNEANQLTRKSALLKTIIEKERQELSLYEVSLEVQLNCTKAGQHTFALTYLSEASFWEPVYELRSAGMAKELHIELNAKVTQHTGLDWDGVALRISTALPQRHTRKPELNPWVLDFYEAALPYNADGREKGVSMSRLDVIAEPESAEVNNFARSSAFLNLEYLPKQLFTIKNAKAESIPLEMHVLKADYQHYAAPRLSKEAYLMAHVVGWDSLRLLPGNAMIYFEQTLISKTWIDFSAVNDTLELALGVDNAVKIEFKENLSFTDQRRISHQQRKQMQYNLEIRNSHATPILIIIEDQIPVSVQKEILVEDLALASAEHLVETGRLKWELNLAASELKKITYGFTVKYPKNKRITNL